MISFSLRLICLFLLFPTSFTLEIRNLTVGVSLTISGGTTRLPSGLAVLHGLQFWQRWYDTAPLDLQLLNYSNNLYRIVLDIRDDQGLPELVTAHYQAFLADPEIVLCLGPINSDFSLIAKNILDGKKMLLQTAAGADATSVGSLSTFGIIVPASLVWRSALLQARLSGATSFAYIAEENTYQQTLCHGTLSLGPEVGLGLPICNFSVPSSLGVIDGNITLAYLQAVEKIAMSPVCASADVVLLCSYYAGATIMVSHMKEINYLPKQILAAPFTNQYDTYPDALYLSGATTWNPKVRFPPDPFYGSPANFTADFEQQFNYTPDFYDALGAAAPLYLSDTLRRATSLDYAELVFAMERIDLSTFYGRLTYGTAHKPLIDAIILQYQPSTNLSLIDKTVVAPPTAQIATLIYPIPQWDQRESDYGWMNYWGDVLMSVIAGLAILFSLMCLICAVFLHNNAVISAAQPEFLGTILIGSILCYLSIYCWLYYVTDASCTALPWLMVTGFSLMFGALFVKTLRLYRVYRASQEFRQIAVPPWQMGVLLACLLGVEWGLLIPWTIIDPLQQKVIRPDPYRPIYDYTVCSMGDTGTGFLIAILVTEGCLLMIAAWIAFLTRRVTFPLFNESKFIGFAIYNLVIISALCVGLVAGLTHDPVSQFWVRTICFIAAPLLVVLCLMIPKFYYMHRGFDKLHVSSRVSSRSRYSADTGHSAGDSTMESPSVEELLRQLKEKDAEIERLRGELAQFR